MPITRRTSERKKSQFCNDENVRKSIDIKQTVRDSKVKALKKIEEIVQEESPRFTVTGKGDADAFDILCSSPLKQEVNFKPLSFWSKKVKDLECKENKKKKKIELYELSETDDSSSLEGKRTKKRGRPAGRRPKNSEKKATKVPYNFNTKNLQKKKNKVNEKKEGSIIRERIILQRLNENCLDKEGKFTFNKVNAFGLTSTPGRKQKLNIVGGSNFDFLSPIAICENKFMYDEMNFEETQDKKSVVEANCFQKETLVTPKKSKKKGASDNVTKDLKRVSENELSRNVQVVDSTLEVDSSPENNLINSCCNTVSVECLFQSSYEKTEDSALDLHQVVHEDNQMNITFLNTNEDEVESEEGDISHFKITEYVERGCHNVNQNSNSQVSLNETDLLRSLISLKVLLKILCTIFDFDVDTTVSSRSSLAASRFPAQPVFFNKSQPVGEDKTNVNNFLDQSWDSGLNFDDSGVTDSSVNSVNENIISKSFPYVQVRRPCNFFLNFRGSAKEEDTNLSCGGSIKNMRKQDTTLQDTEHLDCNSDNAPCCINDSFKIYSPAVKHNIHNLTYSENNTCTIESTLSGESTLTELFRQLEIKDQQTHMDDVSSNLTLVRNCDMRSNQYRSKDTNVDMCGESKELCFTLGNDSSVVLSPEEDREDEVDCSICKNKVNESRNHFQNEISSEMRNTCKNESAKADSEPNNVTCFRVIGGLRQYKKQIKSKKFEGNESRKNSLSVVDSPIVKRAPVENAMSADLTFNDESDFPLPIFESTACKTPDAKKMGESSSRKIGKGTEFNTLGVSEVSQTAVEDTSEPKIDDITSFHLKPGKKWARSAIILKKVLDGSLVLDEKCSQRKRGRRFGTLVEEVLSMQTDAQDQNTIASSYSVAALTNKMSNLTVAMRNFGNRTVKVLEEDGKNNSFQSIFRNNSTVEKFHSSAVRTGAECDEESVRKEEKQYFSARDLVLMRCNQEAPLPFEEYFNEKTLKNCKKIGEGTFGEVFMCSPNRVIKIIPIEGPDEVNGEPQKKFDEIITEMVIAMELSNLRHAEKYRTSGFSELRRCWCVIGKYPQYLIDLWNDFDFSGNGSENDSPEMFNSDQLYIILEFGNGGQDLESFVFTSAEQSYSIFIQVRSIFIALKRHGSVPCCFEIMTRSMLFNEIKYFTRVAFSLAVAERILEFEHRDMHWGNVLISQTRQKYFKVTINGKEYKIPTKGVKVTIIDFTLSRISYEGCSIFNDLSLDLTLFASQGDYQFEIYRMMKDEVMNDWSVFKPRTNLFWMHYILDKMLTMVWYKRADGKIHKIKLIKFSELKSTILDYRDSEDFILNNDLFSINLSGESNSQ